MKKGCFFIPSRDKSKIAKPKPNNLTIEQAITRYFLRYEKTLEKFSKL